MNRLLLFVPLTLATFMLIPDAAAQHWTAEEQEIIDLNHACWEAWAAKDLAAMRRICNEHPDGRGWHMAQGGPDIGWFDRNAERWAAAFHPRTTWVYWEVRPLSVRLFGDTALIHFWATVTREDQQGDLTTENRKQLNIWQRRDGTWTWIGGMSAPDED